MSGSRRRFARERVLQILYAHTLSQEPIGPILEARLADLNGKPAERRFADVLARTVLENLDEIDAIIEARVEHWSSERIAVIDRIILRMGVAELCYFPEIPPKVTINESIEIGKIFSTENSGRFINGILDAVLEEMTARGTIKKSGRGLLDHSLAAGRERKSPPARPASPAEPAEPD